MPVFTILNHGTAYDRNKTGELVGEIGRVMAGQEARVEQINGEPVFFDGSYMVNDGPGSDAVTRPGNINPYTAKKRGWGYTLKKRIMSGSIFGRGGFKRHFYGNTKYSNKGMGMVSGRGWSDNIMKTLFLLSNKLDSYPSAINMIGWSRGAVTCIRLAWHINERVSQGLLPPTPINLFVIDPVVGGPTSRDTSMDHVAPLVERMIGILAMHERRPGFSPLSADKLYVHREASSQDIIYLPMPGKHVDQVERHGVPEATDITWNLAVKFLRACGSELAGLPAGYTELNNATAMAKAYARLILRAPPLPTVNRRAFNGQLDRYVQDGRYFINRHHRLIFEQAFPDLFRYMFRSGGQRPGAGRIAQLRMFAPDVIRSLQATRLWNVFADIPYRNPREDGAGQYSMSWPRGIPLC